MTYKLKADSRCRTCEHSDDCKPFDNIRDFNVYINAHTNVPYALMADGYECYHMEEVEEE